MCSLLNIPQNGASQLQTLLGSEAGDVLFGQMHEVLSSFSRWWNIHRIFLTAAFSNSYGEKKDCEKLHSRVLSATSLTE